MPTIQLSPEREAAAHSAAQARVTLTQAMARASKIASRDPHLITTFALTEMIDAIEATAALKLANADYSAGNALREAARALQTLIPN